VSFIQAINLALQASRVPAACLDPHRLCALVPAFHDHRARPRYRAAEARKAQAAFEELPISSPSAILRDTP